MYCRDRFKGVPSIFHKGVLCISQPWQALIWQQHQGSSLLASKWPHAIVLWQSIVFTNSVYLEAAWLRECRTSFSMTSIHLTAVSLIPCPTLFMPLIPWISKRGKDDRISSLWFWYTECYFTRSFKLCRIYFHLTVREHIWNLNLYMQCRSWVPPDDEFWTRNCNLV